MSIDLETVKQFYSNTQRGQKKFQEKLNERQKKIVDEVSVLRSTITQLQSSQDPWMNAISEPWSKLVKQGTTELEKMSNMRKFNEQFDGLIFMVAGAVNSGKSTLGNFISGQDFAHLSSQAPYTHEQSEFVVFDAQSSRRVPTTHFEEKATECTASIQAFELNQAFTWVDTPGLASLTRENGALAKRYIEGADLVIFVMSSDAPMTREDAQMLKSLGMDQGKPFSILVTKFDEMEEDWDDDLEDLVSRRVPKAERNRREQESYILKELKDHGLGQLAKALNQDTLIFFSKYCAADALKNGDGQLWKASGAPQLFTLFNHILTSEATRLKSLTPIENYNALLRRLIDGQQANDDQNQSSVKQLLQLAEKLSTDLGKEQKSFVTGLQRIQGQVVMEACNLVSSALRGGIGRQSDQQIMQSLNQALGEALERLVTPFVKERLSNILTQSNPQLTIDPLQLTIAKVESVYADISYQAPSKSVTRGGLGGLIGGALGLFGGPIGVAIGSAVGAGLGATMGSGEMKTRRIEVGDNTEVVIQRTLDQFTEEANRSLTTHFAQLSEGTFGLALAQITGAITELKESKQRLEQLYM